MNSLAKFARQTLAVATLTIIPLAAFSALPKAPSINASGYILVNAGTGNAMVEHNADEPLPPASLTKVMTDYIAAYEIEQDRLHLDDTLRVSQKAWKMGGSRMFLQVDSEVEVNDILKGIVVQSGNDAAVALAEHIAGDESAFADIMNEHAERIGMENSNFANATGWPDENQYTSPRDLAKLTRALIQDYPENYDIYKEKYFTYNGIRQPNRNLLLWQDKSVDGVKTGHTDEAGYSLISSAERDGMRLIAVVMGAKSEQARATESQKLLSYGFRNFESYVPYKKDDSVKDIDVWLGDKSSVSLGVAEDLSLTIPKGEQENLSVDLDVEKNLRAPIEKGEEVGLLTISLEDDVIAEVPLVAQSEVKKAGIFKRLWHHLLLFVMGLF